MKNIVVTAINGQATYFGYDKVTDADDHINQLVRAAKLKYKQRADIKNAFSKMRAVATVLKQHPVLCLVVLDNGELQPFAFPAETLEDAVETFSKAVNYAAALGGVVEENTVMYI